MAMQFTVTGKQMDVGDALRHHIEKSTATVVEKYFGNAIEGHAVIRHESYLYVCDLSVHIARGILVQVSDRDADPHVAADKAAERIAKRLRRYKSRLRDHHPNGHDRKHLETVDAPYSILAPPGDDQDDGFIDPTDGQPTVIAEMTTVIPTLTVSEAVMRLDLAEQPMLMFRNGAHGGLNVIYRRKDGHIGWIDPGREPATPRN